MSSLVQTPLDSLPASPIVIVFECFTNLLCHPQRVVLVLSPPLRLSILHIPSRIPLRNPGWDLSRRSWVRPRSPGTVGKHRSELLITSRSLRIPITHLLPAVAHRLSINTCVQLSLRLCGSIRNSAMEVLF